MPCFNAWLKFETSMNLFCLGTLSAQFLFSYDILCIYSDEEVEQLKTLPSINITNVLSSRNNTIGVSKELFEDVEFENNDEDEELLVNKKDLKIEDFNLEQHDTIDLDDI